jgi:hypothetical protein
VSNAKLVSNATVNRSAVEPLRKVFMRAKAVWRYQFPREPLWRNHRLKEPMERMRELHAGEADALAGALRPDFEPWFRFASATGLRLAETLIRWENVNWAAKTIVTIGKGGRTVSTPVTDTIATILEPLKDHHPTAVFTFICQRPKRGQHRGERAPLTYAGAKSEWQAIRKRAGVKGFRFHDVRHDFATKLLRQTKNLKLVSIALNHADVKTTSRYAHVQTDEVAEALQRLSQSKKSHVKSHAGNPKSSKLIDKQGKSHGNISVFEPRVGGSNPSGRANFSRLTGAGSDREGRDRISRVGPGLRPKRHSMKMPHSLHELPAFGHQCSSERDEFLFVRIIEACVQRPSRFDHLCKTCLALPNALRLRQVAIHR